MEWLKKWRSPLLLLIVCGAAVFTVTLGPLPQRTSYHAFADSSALWGVPNALNMLSNFGFVVAGLVGWARLRNQFRSPATIIWQFMFISVALVGLGSSWYHWNPTNESLFWDRLPMSTGFAAMIAGLCADRISCRTGCLLCGPLILISIGTVVFWIYTEHVGTGDLRPYLLLQFISMVLIPLVILLYPDSAGSSRSYWVLWAFYVVAKLCELNDRQIYELTDRLISGHTLKHFAAAAGLLLFHPYPRKPLALLNQRTSIVIILAISLLVPASLTRAGANPEPYEADFFLRAMTMSVAAYPNQESNLLKQALRQKEGWQFSSYVIKDGIVEAEILVASREVSGALEYWLAIGGSNSIADYILDFDAGRINFAKQHGLAAPFTDMHLHRGFHRQTQAILDLPIRLPLGGKEQTLVQFLLKNPSQKIVLTGHCLGGAVAVVLSARLISLGVKPEQIRAVTFGAPSVGDKAFARYFEKRIDITRVVSDGDFMPLLPPKFLYHYWQFGRLVRWKMPKIPYDTRHFKKQYLDFALKNYYDTTTISSHNNGAAPKGTVYIAAIRNELTKDLGGNDFPYMEKILHDAYRDIFGAFVTHPSSGMTLANFEQLRVRAAAAGCHYILFASVWGQRYENTIFPYTIISLDQSIFRVSDGSLVYAATYEDGSHPFTPLVALWTASTIMGTDREYWNDRR